MYPLAVLLKVRVLIGCFPFQYLEHSDVPGETLQSFALLTSFQSLLLPKPREILMEVHACKTQVRGALHQFGGVAV